jgi:hypothetical protein
MEKQTRTIFHHRFGCGRVGLGSVKLAQDVGSVDRLTGLAPLRLLRNLRTVNSGPLPDFGAREVGLGFGMRASEIQAANEDWAEHSW